MGIKKDILEASQRVGIDPYTTPFKPSDLGINSNKYGSFADYCSEVDSISGKYTDTSILQVIQRDQGGRPFKYLLLRSRMNIKELQNKFIDEEIWILTFGGAFQRAEIYKKDNLSNAEREKTRTLFRDKIKQYIKDEITPQYEKIIDENKHIQNIEKFSEWSKRFSLILNGGYLNIGVSQKLINLYLKYLWSLNLIKTPPHCPFDRIIITKLGYTNPPSWTKLDDIHQYKEFVLKAREKAKKENLSIAEWELNVFQRR